MHKRMETTLQWIRNQANKNYVKTDTIPASQLLDFMTFFKDDVILLTHELTEKSLERLRAEQIVAQQELQKHLESMLHEVFLELQSLAALLEKANNGELPPSNEIAELAARLTALENTVAGIRARQAAS